MESLLTDVDRLRSTVQNIDESLQPVTSLLSVDDVQAQLAQAHAQMEQLKSELRKVEAAEPRGLEQDQVDLLKASEEAAKSELDKLTSRCGELECQVELLAQLEDKRRDAENQLNNLTSEVNALSDKYSTPNALVAAEDDLRRSESTKNRLADSAAFLNNANEWLAHEMPNNEAAQNELLQRVQDLEQLESRLAQLRQPLLDEVEREKRLLQEQNALLDQLHQLEDQAIQASETLEPAAFEAIQQDLRPIRERLENLGREAEMEPSKLVQHADLLNLPAVGERVDALDRILHEKAEDAAAKMAFARLAGKIGRETAELRENIQRAQNIEDDPNATSGDLEAAIELLNATNDQLGALEELYNQLDVGDEAANTLRTQAVNDQSALGEALGNTRQALQDRLDTLQRFNDGAQEIESRLRQLKDQVDRIEPAMGEVAFEQLAPLSNEEAELREGISGLAQSLPALLPLQQPASRHDDLQRLAHDVHEQLEKAKNASDAAKHHQQAISDYTDELARLEDALRSLERDADAAPNTSEALQPLADLCTTSLIEPIRHLDAREAPTDELKERRSRLKERARELNQRLNDAGRMAQHQEALLDGVNRDLDAVEQAINQQRDKYQARQPLDEAINDKALLENLIIDRLSPLIGTLQEVEDRNTREGIFRRIDELRNNIDALSTPIGEEIRREEDLLKAWRDFLGEFNRLGEEVLHPSTSEEPNADLARATQLSEELRQLQLRAEKLDERIQEPTRFVHRPIPADESLAARVGQLQDELANKRRAITSRLALASVAPEIQLVSESLQKRLGEFAESAEPTPVEHQEQALHELEENKRRLESLLEQIPEGPEGDELRQRSEWNLNSLRDLLNRLADAVGEKVQAIAAFLASKKEAESQLAHLQDQLNRIEADGTQSPEALRNQLHDLGVEEARLAKLKAQLEDEHRPKNLDAEKQAELHALLREIEAANDHLKTVRENLQQRHNAALDLERLHGDIARASNELAGLTEQGRRTLNDAAVIPQTYSNLAAQLYEAINAALNLVAEAPTTDAEVLNLQETISEAQPVHQALATRAAVWEQFVRERDNANVQLDSARRPLDEIETKGLRPLGEAQQDLEALVNGQEQLIPLDTTLDTLQKLSEQLDPLETAYADVRFFDVDMEQTREQYEDLLTALRNEIDEENALNEATRQVKNELDRLSQHAQTDNKDVLQQLKQHELPALLAQSELLRGRDLAARNERRVVQRPDVSLEAELNNQLKQLTAEVSSRLNDISMAERQQAVEALRLEVDLLKSQPPTEETIERIQHQLETLPRDDASVEVLQKELNEVRAKKDAQDALKRRLQDELSDVAEKLQRIEDATKPSEAEKPRKKKKGKKEPAELKPAERKARIQLLSEAINELNNQLTPKLAQIQAEAFNSEVEVAGLEPQQQKASKLTDAIAVIFLKKILKLP